MTVANVDEREMVIELFEGKTGFALGDKSYLEIDRAEQNIKLIMLLNPLLDKTREIDTLKTLRMFRMINEELLKEYLQEQCLAL